MGFSLPPRSAAASFDSVEAVGEPVREGKRDQRKRVWSSEPDMSTSGVVDSSLVYRASARD
jgi:hypothetical protein